METGLMRLALKVDVDTHRGTREGVPQLTEILERHGARATFLFSLGPDHTGRAIRRVFKPGFMKKVSRTSVMEHYGIITLLYGTLLPGPDIGRRNAEIMRRVRDAGHEAGIHTFDHVKWQDGTAHQGAEWTRREMGLAYDRFQEIFAEPPAVHGAAGWQMNLHAYRLTQRLGFRYCSDTRGTCPFIPVYNAEIIACPQLPTTLPTLDELIGVDGITAENVANHILSLSEAPPAGGHVYTLHAELEGMKFSRIFEKLLLGWRALGYELGTLGDYGDRLDIAGLPRHTVLEGSVPGRAGTLALQGREFLA
jgi:undecaprenyl phosphate-alpha-L-ara4FN deformylase